MTIDIGRQDIDIDNNQKTFCNFITYINNMLIIYLLLKYTSEV